MTLEHDFGWGTAVKVSYLGSFGRELPDFVDTNINPSISNITYNVVPGGSLAGPTLVEPLFTTRPNTAFGAMTDIFSGVNSRYDAFVVEVSHRMSHHIQFSVNYTRSRSQDFGQNESTFSDTNDLLLPNTIAPEKGPSIYDVPYRLVAHAVISSPWKKTGWAAWFANDWEIDPIYQIQSGLPYTLRTSGSAPGGLGGGINGSGGDNRIDVIGRNTFRLPGVWVTDLRLAKYFSVSERYKLELAADFFNLANKQNVTGINSTGYSVGTNAAVCGVVATPCLAPSSTFGTVTNTNSNFQYTPRQVQLGARFRF